MALDRRLADQRTKARTKGGLVTAEIYYTCMSVLLTITSVRNNLRILCLAGPDSSKEVVRSILNGLDQPHHMTCGWTPDVGLIIGHKALSHGNPLSYCPCIHAKAKQAATEKEKEGKKKGAHHNVLRTGDPSGARIELPTLARGPSPSRGICDHGRYRQVGMLIAWRLGSDPFLGAIAGGSIPTDIYHVEVYSPYKEQGPPAKW